MSNMNKREQFAEFVSVIEDAAFVITSEKYDTDRMDDELLAQFWILEDRNGEDHNRNEI